MKSPSLSNERITNKATYPSHVVFESKTRTNEDTDDRKREKKRNEGKQFRSNLKECRFFLLLLLAVITELLKSLTQSLTKHQRSIDRSLAGTVVERSQLEMS